MIMRLFNNSGEGNSFKHFGQEKQDVSKFLSDHLEVSHRSVNYWNIR